jgi:Trk-type K+ transport system membrane component
MIIKEPKESKIFYNSSFNRLKQHHDFMWTYLQDLLLAMMRPSVAFLMFSGLTVTCLFALVFYLVEVDAEGSTVHSFFDAVYFTVTAMTTVGLGDVHPVTTAGRAISMFMMIVGSGLFISYTAVFSAVVIQIERQRWNADKDSKI